jgi:prepilin peptidase CpaA
MQYFNQGTAGPRVRQRMTGAVVMWSADLVTAVIVGLLIFAALADVAARIIPDGIAIGIAVLGLAARVAAGGLPSVAVSIAAALLVLMVLMILHARRMMGGGDVKLAAAMVLGLPLDWVYRFFIVTALAGGIIALLHLVLRAAVRTAPRPPPRGASLLRRALTAEWWRIARRGSLPYGVAIACGGIWTILASRGG